MERQRETSREDDTSDGLLDIVARALVERELHYDAFEENAVFTHIRAERATYQLFVSVDEERDTLGVYLCFPTRVPEARRVAVAELCARINRETFIGNLDIAFADGDLRWRAGIDVEDGALSTTMIHNMIGAGIWTLDRYHDALVKVIVAGAEPEIAFREVEEGGRRPLSRPSIRRARRRSIRRGR